MKNKYLKISILFILCLVSSFVYTQERFNLYNFIPPYNHPLIFDIYPLADTAYALIGQLPPSLGEPSSIAIYLHDEEGTFTQTKYILDENYVNFGIAYRDVGLKKTDKGYILLGNLYKKEDWISMWDGEGFSVGEDSVGISLIAFNETFDTLWTKKHFYETCYFAAIAICQTSDKGYAVVGETSMNQDSSYSSTAQNAMLLKFDNLGNLEWSKIYNFGSGDRSGLSTIVATHDGGFLLGGGTATNPTDISFHINTDIRLFKTDSLGNIEWFQQYGDTTQNNPGFKDIIRTSDSSYYAVGGMFYGLSPSGNDYYESIIVKFNKNFNEEFTLKLDSQRYQRTILLKAKEDEYGNIVCLGNRSYTSLLHAILRKITPEGNLLWNRQYTATTDTMLDSAEPYSFALSPNGGYIIGGRVLLESSFADALWLVKTDSFGCDGTNIFNDCYIPGFHHIDACETYTWINDSTYTESTQTPHITIPNGASSGLDSIVFLDLNIHHAQWVSDEHETCSSFTWVNDSTYLETSIGDTLMYTDIYGCDSIVMLRLEILKPDTSIDNQDPTLIGSSYGTHYQWLDCSKNYIPIEGATSSSFTPEENGWYALEITLSSCKDTSACYPISQTGKIDMDIKKEFRLYPNPVHGTLWIEYILLPEANSSFIGVYQSDGKELRRIPIDKKMDKIAIDVSSLKQGSYFLRFEKEEKAHSFIVK